MMNHNDLRIKEQIKKKKSDVSKLKAMQLLDCGCRYFYCNSSCFRYVNLKIDQPKLERS